MAPSPALYSTGEPCPESEFDSCSACSHDRVAPYQDAQLAQHPEFGEWIARPSSRLHYAASL
jgi:hypothetical protein